MSDPGLLTGLTFEILVLVIAVEIALLLGVRLFVEIGSLTISRPNKNIFKSISDLHLTSTEDEGQFLPEEDVNEPTNDERIWAREQGAKTEKEITNLLKNTEGL